MTSLEIGLRGHHLQLHLRLHLAHLPSSGGIAYWPSSCRVNRGGLPPSPKQAIAHAVRLTLPGTKPRADAASLCRMDDDDKLPSGTLSDARRAHPGISSRAQIRFPRSVGRPRGGECPAVPVDVVLSLWLLLLLPSCCFMAISRHSAISALSCLISRSQSSMSRKSSMSRGSHLYGLQQLLWQGESPEAIFVGVTDGAGRRETYSSV
ncbi:hypothetical protein GGR56DRAFT_77181 [Xylariaceae sp. FL0804]|nr:hypothetical protein GGR56DRAFT_77181 [Xylariaceae sp. FL0804]